MNTPTFVLLGGYGKTGTALARLLLQHTNARIVIAGPDGYRVDALMRQLNRTFPDYRVSGARADVTMPATLKEAFSGADMVIVTSNMVAYTERIAMACLEVDADYLDVSGSTHNSEVLRGIANQIKEQGRCFIIEAGLYPGIPAALVRYIAPKFERLTGAIVAGLCHPQEGVPDSACSGETIAELPQRESAFYREGVWQKTRWNHAGDFPRFVFDAPFGERQCNPLMLEEMRALPTLYPTLQETGFLMAGFDPVTDHLTLPLITGMASLLPGTGRAMGQFFHWSTKRFGHPPYGVTLNLEAAGERQGFIDSACLTLFHHDFYQFMAISIAACLQQWQQGRQEPGLHLAALMVEPGQFLRDMERFGLHISGTHWPGSNK